VETESEQGDRSGEEGGLRDGVVGARGRPGERGCKGGSFTLTRPQGQG
jgi:hypothetical protein